MKQALIVAALLLLAPAGWAAGEDGAELFTQHCASCHQPDGSGAVGLAPALKGEHWAKLGADRGYLLAVLLKGLSGPITVNGQPFVGSMPAFAQLDDAALAALATHVRQLQGAGGDKPFAADEVAPQRAAAGNPSTTRQRRVKLLGG